jgi:hypothetical protein
MGRKDKYKALPFLSLKFTTNHLKWYRISSILHAQAECLFRAHIHAHDIGDRVRPFLVDVDY